MQLASSAFSPCSQPELGGLELPGNMLPAELQAHVVKGVSTFLSFAAWLAAAFWPLSEMEQTRLAYLDQGDPSSVTAAAAILRLPAITSIQDLFSPSALNCLSQWQPHGFSARLTPMAAAPALPGLVPFIDLPELYLENLRRLIRCRCSVCNTEPSEPALCLLCGAIVCVDSLTCRHSISEGQCTGHARQCGAGQGLFLLPYRSQILGVSAPVCCLWDCPYVDRQGEPNPGLKRPCALQMRLDDRKLTSLRRMYTT